MTLTGTYEIIMYFADYYKKLANNTNCSEQKREVFKGKYKSFLYCADLVKEILDNINQTKKGKI